LTIDLNCDMGELPDGPEELLMPHITWANIACGAHAGDSSTMEHTIRLAKQHGVTIGAHPGYPDKANFGRLELAMSAAEIAETVFEQVRLLAQVASRLGCEVAHVKPHGALYHVAATRADVAEAIAAGTARWSKDVMLVGLAGSQMLDVWQSCGFEAVAEGFADRAYEAGGRLRPRGQPGAVITDPETAAQQALGLARQVRTICVHGDNPNAVNVAAAVRKILAARA